MQGNQHLVLLLIHRPVEQRPSERALPEEDQPRAIRAGAHGQRALCERQHLRQAAVPPRRVRAHAPRRQNTAAPQRCVSN